MADSGGPKRVLLDDFTMTISPTAYALTMVQASEIKDIAEELVEAHLEQYDWGPSTLYQYMGFTNIEAVSFYDQSYSVIRVKGGIVSFDGSSESIPSQVEIQEMIQQTLDPAGGGGLKKALQATEDFAYVTETIYEVLWEPTPAPSVATVPPPTLSPVTPKTSSTPPPSPGLVSVPVVDSDGNGGTASSLLPVIAGIAAGLVLLATAAVLLVYQRRRNKAAWRKNADHTFPADDDLEQHAMSKSDAVVSEAGSSRLGRLLTAAVHGSRGGNMSEATPPQSSSDEGDSFSEFDDGVSVEPIIVPIDNTEDYVNTVESEELEPGIAELVALQIVSQELKQGREPDIEEGVVFVDNSGDSEADFSEFNEECAVFVEPLIVPIKKDDYGGAEKEKETKCDVGQVREVGDATGDTQPFKTEIFSEEDSTEAGDGDKCKVAVRAVGQENDVGETPPSTTEILLKEDEGRVEADSVDVDDEEAPLLLGSDTTEAESQAIVEDIKMQLDSAQDRDLLALAKIVANKNETEENTETPVYTAQQDSDLMTLIDSSDVDTAKVVDEAEALLGAEQESILIPSAVDNSEVVETAAVRINTDEDSEVQVPAWQELDESHQVTRELAFLEAPPNCAALGCSPYNRWSEVSSTHSRAPSLSDDDQLEFKPDESWDFNDNDDDSTDLVDDPFQSPSALEANDTKPLLQHTGTLSLETQTSSGESAGGDPPSLVQSCDSDTTSDDPFQTPSTVPMNDEKPLLRRILSTYKLDKIATSDSERQRRSRSAPPPSSRRRSTDL